MAHSITEKENTFPTTLLSKLLLGNIVKEMFGGRVSITKRVRGTIKKEPT